MTTISKRTSVYVDGTPLGLANLSSTHPEIPGDASIVDAELQFEDGLSMFEDSPLRSRLKVTLEWPA